MNAPEIQLSNLSREGLTPILIVDDEQDHALFIKEALAATSIPLSIAMVQSGEEAILYLCGDGKFADRDNYPFPFLVLLDLRMPGIGGFGLLRWLCARPDLKQRLNLVVLSAVQSSKEIEVVYELGAQLFWPKADCDALQKGFRVWHESWGGENRLRHEARFDMGEILRASSAN